MVQKEDLRSRGRPRQYDPDQALAQAMRTFWRNGYAATSMDDLSVATKMNRPSLYNAFGNKRAIYLSLLDRYIATIGEVIHDALGSPLSLKQALNRLYRKMLTTYTSSEGEGLGCFLVGTAATEAVRDEEVRARLAGALAGVHQALEVRLHQAQSQGDLARQADVAGLAAIASAVLHSLAVQVRAGVPRTALLRMIHSAVNLICADNELAGKRKEAVVSARK